jgi:hypothetical protein
VIIECNNVPEVIRVLRWMGEQTVDVPISVALRSIPIDLNGLNSKLSKSNDCSVPAKHFMATVSDVIEEE